MVNPDRPPHERFWLTPSTYYIFQMNFAFLTRDFRLFNEQFSDRTMRQFRRAAYG